MNVKMLKSCRTKLDALYIYTYNYFLITSITGIQNETSGRRRHHAVDMFIMNDTIKYEFLYAGFNSGGGGGGGAGEASPKAAPKTV